MFEDFIFYSTLISSIFLGYYYKRITDLETKRNYGMGLGIFITWLICGTQILHTIIMLCGNIFIIKCSDRRYVHYMSLSWTWMYLIYLHIHLASACYVIWLHQTMALRLVGLAFELHCANRRDSKASTSGRINSTGDTEYELNEPNVIDIVSYAFFFIGLHKGPYYKWKIFNEHLHNSFGVLGDCRVITHQKLKKTFFCLCVIFLLRMKYTPKIFYEERFYTHYDTDTRYLYNIPLLLMFFLQHHVILLLATSACTEAGFGVYPAKCQPLPGHGPSIRFSLLKLTGNLEKALEEEFNFSMLKCFDNNRILIGPRMKDTLKSWDMSTRYWFWACTYKNLVKANKEVRSMCSYLMWTVWSGFSIQQLLISVTLWVYIHVESEYSEIYETSALAVKGPWDIGFSMMRMFCLIYLTPCLVVVNDAAVLLKYYNSIFWIYHIFLLISIVGAIVIHKICR